MLRSIKNQEINDFLYIHMLMWALFKDGEYFLRGIVYQNYIKYILLD